MGFFSSPNYLELRSSHFFAKKVLDSGVEVCYLLDRRLRFFRRIVVVEVCNQVEVDWVEEFVESIMAESPNVDFIAKPQANVVIQGQAGKFPGLKTVPWGTHIKDIVMPDEELLYSFKGNTRRDIQKAIAQGVEVRDVDAVVCHEMLKDMFYRQGQPAYAPSLELLKGFETTLKDHVIMLGAFDQGELQSIVAIPFDEQRGYYLYGASVPRPSRGAMHLLQYEVMCRLRDEGVKEYDFFGARIDVDKGSKIAGIQRFKESFKPRLVEGYSFKVILRPWKYRLFELAVSVFYRLKGAKYQGDAIDQIIREKKSG